MRLTMTVLVAGPKNHSLHLIKSIMVQTKTQVRCELLSWSLISKNMLTKIGGFASILQVLNFGCVVYQLFIKKYPVAGASAWTYSVSGLGALVFLFPIAQKPSICFSGRMILDLSKAINQVRINTWRTFFYRSIFRKPKSITWKRNSHTAIVYLSCYSPLYWSPTSTEFAFRWSASVSRAISN